MGDDINANDPREDRLWLPVSAYLVEHPKGLFLVDTGWARAMSPEGVFDKHAQVKSLDPLCVESLANHDPDVEPRGRRRARCDSGRWPRAGRPRGRAGREAVRRRDNSVKLSAL